VRAFEPRHAVCDRARQWASLRLDGELSQLEEALLDAHLTSCGSCADFVSDTYAATSLLRAAPLEVPAQQVGLPARRRVALGGVRLGAAAAVAVAVVGAGALFGSLGSSNRRAPAVQPPGISIAEEQRLLHEPRVLMRPGVKRGIGISV
jgi:hypothetical protein